MKYVRICMGELPFRCSYPDCDYKCSTSRSIVAHVGTHTGPFSCNFGDCEYQCSTPQQIVAHVKRHIDPFPYPCNFPGCNFRSAYKNNITSHMKTHSPEGQIRHKMQENRVNRLLKKWGYTADVEVTINASRNNCVQDTQRYYSNLDFTIVNCVKAILILEVDEFQHQSYNISCEFCRMADVRASLIGAGYELPIYWLRYSPTGEYHVGTNEVEFSRLEREVVLKAKLDELCSPDFVPEHQVNIHYAFYDLISEEGGPKIMTDCDFPDALRECVSWSFVPKQPKFHCIITK